MLLISSVKSRVSCCFE